MSENIDIKNSVETVKPENTESAMAESLSMGYVLKRIDKIIEDTAYIHEIIRKLGESQNSIDRGIGGTQSKNDALAKVVMCRETTNQQILKFLEKMYDDLKPQPQVAPEPGSDEQKFAAVCESLKKVNPDEYSPEMLELLKKSAQQMFVKPYAAVV